MEELKIFIKKQIDRYSTVTRDDDDTLYEKTPVVSNLTYNQIPTLFSALTDEHKTYVVNGCVKYQRQNVSNDVVNYFASDVMDAFKRDLDSGEPLFKTNALKIWNQFRENVFAYNPVTEQKLYFVRWLGIQEDQNVYLVKEKTNDVLWVLKFEDTRNITQENTEALEYNYLESLGAQCPLRLNGFKLLNFYVLVIEFLYPLDATDNAVLMAKQLLTTQLKHIHTYACYFDLKPDNIKKRNSVPPKYFIIDMNLSKEMLQDGGFKRLHWTPLYSSQTFPRETAGTRFVQFSNYVHDLIELSYVVHQMIAQRAFESKYGIFKNIEESISNGYRELSLKPGDYLADPDRMNNNPVSLTSRGWKVMKQLLEYPLDSGDVAGITQKYISAVYRLPQPYAPANIHSLLAETFDVFYYERFFRETEKTLIISCSICSSIGVKQKCAHCYQKTTPLCSKMCAAKHECK